MAAVTPQQIRELRERTQAGMTDCKNALVEAQGDVEAAVEIILKKGLAKAAKRSAAVATEGEIRAVIAPDLRSGVMVEINIQTDFAARNERFQEFLREVTEAARGCKTLEELMKAPLPSTDRSVEQTRDTLMAAIGEKIDVRRLARTDLRSPAGRIHSYVHMNGKIGVLLETTAESPAVASHEAFLKFVDDTCMQIAAMNPFYLNRDEIPAQDLSKQREIFQEQVKGENKPEAAWPKIVDGKIHKWFTDVCLMDQASIIHANKSVEQVRAEAIREVGGSFTPVRFVRFQLGEGLQRKEDDFADQAKKMAGIS